jgi:protocatechuate 3,4-dioxygenase beta subunit
MHIGDIGDGMKFLVAQVGILAQCVVLVTALLWSAGGTAFAGAHLAPEATGLHDAVFQSSDVPACGFARLQGTVTAADTGVPLENVGVTRRTKPGLNSPYFTIDRTDAAGDFLADLPVYQNPGPYYIGLLPPKGRYAEFVLKEPLTPKSGDVITLNLQVPVGAAIEGTVTDVESGLPVSGTAVLAYTGGAVVFPEMTSNITGEDGRYRIEGLSEGAYGLRVVGPKTLSPQGSWAYAISFLGGSFHPAQGGTISVASASTYEVDMSIERGVSITGRVTDAANGDPVEGATVSPYIVDEEGSSYFAQQLRTATDADGGYTLLGLAPNARYKLLVRPPADRPDLLAQWINNRQFEEDATVVQTSPSGLTVDVALEAGAMISGQVRGAGNGPPIANAEVLVEWLSDDNIADCGLAATQCRPFYTDDQGVYTLPALYSGTYALSFLADFDDEVYVDAEAAVTVTVSAPGTYTDIDGVLSKGGEISGRVMDPEGNPLTGVSVRIFQEDGTFWDILQTDKDGMYGDLLPAGRYQLRFDRNEPCGCYNQEYYSTDGAGDTPTLIEVRQAQITGDLDQVLACGAAPIQGLPIYLPLVTRR